MNELVERYVHQVGRYLPKKERAEIEAELRSQIEDQLEDRCGGSCTQQDTAAVLAELGDPRTMAKAYSGERYLIGPDLYPFMMMVLRNGWLIVPSAVIFLYIFGGLIANEPVPIIRLIVESAFAALQVTFIFSAVVVLIFAAIQHSGLELELDEPFDPLKLPAVDDPGVVDRLEGTVGIAIGIFGVLILLYFLSVGGLTLRFNLSDPGEVIPAPASWMVALIALIAGMSLMELIALRRNRWSATTWLVETLLEVFASICLYFAVLKPLFDSLIAANPSLAGMPIIANLPELFTISYVIILLVVRGIRLIKLWNYAAEPAYTATGEGR